MSGWDQEYDINSWDDDEKRKFQDFERQVTLDYEAWARQVEQEAIALQKTNKAMRWMYLIPAVILLVVGFILRFGLFIAVGVLFVALFAWNEHMIRKFKRAGIK